MNPIFQEVFAGANHYTDDACLVAIFRKASYLKANKYLKDNNLIVRYKHNYGLKEVFDSGYKKTVTGMVGDFMEAAFKELQTHVVVEKNRGQECFKISFMSPTTEEKRLDLEDALAAFTNQNPNLFYFYRYDIRPGRRVNCGLYYTDLDLMAGSLDGITRSMDFEAFKARLTPLINALKVALLPTPVVVNITLDADGATLAAAPVVT